MSSIFSQELVPLLSDCREPECDLLPSARSNLSAGACLQSTGPIFPAIPTLETSTDSSVLTGSAAVSPVSRLVQRLEDAEPQPTSGPKCSASSIASDPHGSSAKTSRKRQSPTRLSVSMDLAIQRTTAVYRELMQGRTISEIVGGSLHTPTRKANFTAPSMQKWPSCRRFVLAFGGREITPEQFEFLMGLPIGWTELEPSETLSSRSSRKRSGAQS